MGYDPSAQLKAALAGIPPPDTSAAYVQTPAEVYLVWYGRGTFPEQLGGLQLPLTPYGGLSVPITDVNVAAFRALPWSAFLKTDVVFGDPEYQLQYQGRYELGSFVAVAKSVTSAQAALADPDVVSAVRQWSLENGLLGTWIQTIRPATPQDNGDDITHDSHGNKFKTYVLQLTGPYHMTPDHHWHKVVSIGSAHVDVDLGWALAPCKPPQHGLSGLVQGLGDILSTGFKDLIHNPIGAMLSILVVISAAPLAPFAAGALQVVTAAAALTGHIGTELDAAKWVAEHPAEVGEVVAGAELIIAGAVVGAKGLSNFGKGLLAKGVNDAIGNSGSPQLPTDPGDPNQALAPQDQLSKDTHAGRYWWSFFTR